MFRNSLKALVAFDIVEKISILNDTKKQYLVIVPKESNQITWPEAIDLGYEKLTMVRDIDSQLKQFVPENAIFYQITYEDSIQNLRKYLIDVDVGAGKIYLEHLMETLPEETVYDTLTGVLISEVLAKSIFLYAPVLNMFKESLEGETNE